MNIQNEIINRQQEVKTESFLDAIVIGVGGIGSWAALNLALSGRVGQLFIIDPDIVESSNLNRTPFRICDIGNPKVDALKYLILERRVIDVYTYREKTSPRVLKQITDLLKSAYRCTDQARIIPSGVIIDCRDDVYDDFYSLPYKYYKIGYDGLSITIDGNPRNTAVWGRANGYRFTPSFICPSQLAANLVVTDILTTKVTSEELSGVPWDTTTNPNPFDLQGRINKAFTFDCKDVIETLYRESLENEGT